MMLLRKLIYLILTVVFFASCISSSSDKNSKDDSLQYYPPVPKDMDRNEFRRYFRELKIFFDTTLVTKGFNGGILVAKNGSIIYEKYCGLINIRKQDSLSENTPLHIASTSKTFTATAILQLAQEGKLSLNDTISKFFPGFPYKPITVKMLLNHRSGLPNYLYFMSNNKWGILPNGKWNRQYATNADVLKMMYEKKPDPVSSPGTRFNYCNTNYILLALIVEKISGLGFPEYLQQKIFSPLQMQHSFVFTLKDTLTASPSFTNKGVLWDYDFLDATYGDKNIYTTPRDLLKWDQALYTDELIEKDLKDSAFSGYSFEKPSIHNYGFGWRLQLLENGKKVVYHFGKWHGNNAAFARLLDEKVTIIILGNKFNRAIYDAAHLSYDIFGDYKQKQVMESEETDSLNTLNQISPIKSNSKKSRK